jgi:hypothetical protein
MNPRLITKKNASLLHHPTIPEWFVGDQVGELKDCPFPLKTDTFQVLAWGSIQEDFTRDKKYGHTPTLTLVEYVKSCGHLVRERIPFYEDTQDFDHYGTMFYGADYSVKAWERRIEFFRTNLPCEVCAAVRHAMWIYNQKLGTPMARPKAIKQCCDHLDYNYENWREFVSEKQITNWFNGKDVPVYIQTK